MQTAAAFAKATACLLLICHAEAKRRREEKRTRIFMTILDRKKKGLLKHMNKEAIGIDGRSDYPTFSSALVIPSILSLRCSAERSMPTKFEVLEILPPKRSICAARYCFSNSSRA